MHYNTTSHARMARASSLLATYNSGYKPLPPGRRDERWAVLTWELIAWLMPDPAPHGALSEQVWGVDMEIDCVAVHYAVIFQREPVSKDLEFGAMIEVQVERRNASDLLELRFELADAVRRPKAKFYRTSIRTALLSYYTCDVGARSGPHPVCTKSLTRSGVCGGRRMG